MIDSIPNLIGALLIAVATAVVTVHLSLKRFRAEKWWEHKFNAYKEILDALHEARRFSDEHLTAGYKFREVSEDRDKELREASKASQKTLLRVIDLSEFLLCTEAVQILKQYEKDVDDLDGQPTWFDYIDADNTINYRTLKALIPVARKDLAQ